MHIVWLINTVIHDFRGGGIGFLKTCYGSLFLHNTVWFHPSFGSPCYACKVWPPGVFISQSAQTAAQVWSFRITLIPSWSVSTPSRLIWFCFVWWYPQIKFHSANSDLADILQELKWSQKKQQTLSAKTLGYGRFVWFDWLVRCDKGGKNENGLYLHVYLSYCLKKTFTNQISIYCSLKIVKWRWLM
jgi:hypothetical protein